MPSQNQSWILRGAHIGEGQHRDRRRRVRPAAAVPSDVAAWLAMPAPDSHARRYAFNSARISVAVCMRSRGCFSRHRSMSRDRLPEVRARRLATGLGWSLRIDDISAGDESPRNGRSPVAISYSTMPSENISVRGSRRLAFDLFGRHVRHRADDRACLVAVSGNGVVSPRRTASAAAAARGRSRAPSRGPSSETMTLAGFRSRCVRCFRCAAAKRVGQGNRDVEELRRAAKPPAGIKWSQRAPFNQFHRQERAMPSASSSGEDRDDVRVIEGGNGVGFARERSSRHGSCADGGRAAP